MLDGEVKDKKKTGTGPTWPCVFFALCYFTFLGLTAYFVTPYVLLILIAGFSCKGDNV